MDHTSLIKTILQRFAADPEQAIAKMGTRVQHAQHLGIALADSPRTDIPDHDSARAQITDWRAHARAARRGSATQGLSVARDGESPAG